MRDKLSFEEQTLLGEHITEKTISYSIPDEQVVRSSVPIKVNGVTESKNQIPVHQKRHKENF